MGRHSRTIAVWVLFILAPLCVQAQPELFESARSKQAKGDFVSAEQLYREFLRANPKSVPALTNLGVVLARQGRYSAAIAMYGSALKIDPGALPALINLGLSYYRMSEWHDAAESFEKVLAKNPDDRRSRQLLAVSLSQLGDCQRGAAEYEKLMPSTDPAILVGLAACYKDTKREEESEKILAKLLETQGDSPQVYYLLGLTAYARKDYPDAITKFQKCLSIAPGMIEARFYVGAVYFKQDDFRSALKEWESAGKSDLNYFPAFFAAGALLVDLQASKDAQPFLERAYTLRPQDSAVQLALGKDLLNLDQPHKALPLLESAAREDRKSQPASFLLARTLKALGRKEEAAAEFERCRTLFDDGVGVLGDPVNALNRDEH